MRSAAARGPRIGWFSCLFLLAVAGPASAADDPRTRLMEQSIDRAVAWVRTVNLDPYGGDILNFRLYAVEVEIWHRLARLEPDASRRSVFESEAHDRLERAIDGDALTSLLTKQEDTNIYSEILVLIHRARQYNLNPREMGDALRGVLPDLEHEIASAPASVKALYAAYLPAARLDLGYSLEDLRQQGILARRPDETTLTLADIYYLTHEIFAFTDYASIDLRMSSEERDYLLRVLPFYTLFYSNLDNIDIMAELLSCLHSAGMRDTFAYQEGLRVLVERQNSDGSFGTVDPRALGRPVTPADYLHPTMNALWALQLELYR
jgi:hypothetical protein